MIYADSALYDVPLGLKESPYPALYLVTDVVVSKRKANLTEHLHAPPLSLEFRQ